MVAITSETTSCKLRNLWKKNTPSAEVSGLPSAKNVKSVSAIPLNIKKIKIIYNQRREDIKEYNRI